MTRIEKEETCFDAPADRWSARLVEVSFLAPDPQFIGPGDASSPLGVVGVSRIG